MAASASEKPRRGDLLPFLASAGRSVSSALVHLSPFPHFSPRRAAAAGPVALPDHLNTAAVTVPFLLPPFTSSASSISSSCQRSQRQSATSPSSSAEAMRSFASGVRIEGLASSSKGGGGPAFVGQVFSMLDPSGNGLMAVTTRFDIPFLSKRTPAWIKKMLTSITKNEEKGPVFRFFMDLTDAVRYVKSLNVPTGMVGACRLDVAYEHFKEKPHMFQFVPNKKQVKAANDILKRIPRKHAKKKIDGVPVFTAQNLNIAIATNDEIKWYTPYFFDKSMLDKILEASIDQHFNTLIHNRHVQRRREVIDDNLSADVVEEFNDSFFEPPEVQEVLDEMGQFGIPMSVISKAAEIQVLDAVDKVLLGNKWLRKATGIQPKFPYLVESFEERSATSILKASLTDSAIADSEGTDKNHLDLEPGASNISLDESLQHSQSSSRIDFQFPFGNWFTNPWSRQRQNQNQDNQTMRNARSNRHALDEIPLNPLLPKITMVGISMGEGGQMSRANLKKTMEDLTKELEQANQKSRLIEDKDPLFIANVGDYSSITRMSP